MRLGILVAVFIALFVVLRGSQYGIVLGHPGSYDHHLQTTLPSAFEAMPGERVVVGGIDAGSITAATVTKAGRAHLVLGIDDNQWPLPSDTHFELRMSGTIKYTDRLVDVVRGHSAENFADDGMIPAAQFQTPVEYGQFFDIFDNPTRQSMRNMFDIAGPTLKAASGPFQQTLPIAAGPLRQGAAIFGDLGYSERALSTLVISGGQLTKAIATSNPGLQTLLDGASGTFQQTALESSDITRLLEIGHRTNIGIGNILFHGAALLPRVAALAHQLNPGLTELDRTAAPLGGTLRELTSLEPAAVHTLTTVRTQSPAINALLATARTQFLPQLRSVASQAATELTCIRPYTPDIMNILDGFAGFNGEIAADTTPHLHGFHALVSVIPIPTTFTTGTKELHSALPDLNVGYHPAGTGWNQPWYQPNCGETATSNTAVQDGENGTYDPYGSKLVPYPSTTPNYGHPIPARDTPAGS